MDQKRVERAAKALEDFVRNQGVVWPNFKEVAYSILNAADTEEPEIVVTEEMIGTGCRTYARAIGVKVAPAWNERGLTAAYRAMRPLEPIPPFTEKMREAMRDEYAKGPSRIMECLRPMYEAARKLEGKS